MMNKLNYKLAGIAFFLSGIMSFSAIGSVTDNSKPPTATKEEAKIKHWRSPQPNRSFRDIPELETPFIDTSPLDMKDNIAVAELANHSKQKNQLLQLAKEIAKGKHGKLDSLLILHQGKLLFESYYRRGRVNLSHPQSSATKSYTSLALGRAIQLGYLSMADLNKPIVSFLKNLKPERFAPGAETITLHNALTMTTGIVISEAGWKEIEDNPSWVTGQKEVQTLFERSAPVTNKSKEFNYGTGPQLIMQVIDAVVPGTAEDFIKNELLLKLGITNYGWKTAASGLPTSGSQASITSRDMAKFGLLAMNKGKWQGQQLVSEAFITKATSPVIDTGDDDIFGGGDRVSNQGYGYYWWNGDLRHNGKHYYSASAQGGGGMYIILIDELDLVVVVTAHHRDDATLQLVAERIIPAFVG